MRTKKAIIGSEFLEIARWIFKSIVKFSIFLYHILSFERSNCKLKILCKFCDSMTCLDVNFEGIVFTNATTGLLQNAYGLIARIETCLVFNFNARFHFESKLLLILVYRGGRKWPQLSQKFFVSLSTDPNLKTKEKCFYQTREYRL